MNVKCIADLVHDVEGIMLNIFFDFSRQVFIDCLRKRFHDLNHNSIKIELSLLLFHFSHIIW